MKQYKNNATVISDPRLDGDNIPNMAKTKMKNILLFGNRRKMK